MKVPTTYEVEEGAFLTCGDSLEQENLKAVRGFDGASGGERDDKITITGRIMSEGTRSNEDWEQQTLAGNLVHHQFQDWRPLQKDWIDL